MNHYFTDNRHLAENQKEIFFRSWCFNVPFITDNDVLPKGSADFSIQVLFNTLYKHEEELGNQLLDMGCGYGVVGIVTKKAWLDKQVEMVDVNPRAVELARDNAEENNIEADIHVSDAHEQISGSTFTDIITNPPTRADKDVIYNVFEEVWNHLVDQGTLWAVARKQQGARSAVAKIKGVFGNCDIIHKEKGYSIPKVKKALTI